MRRRVDRAVVAAATAAVLTVASPVGAEPLLQRADAEELAQILAEAADEHDICYGWDVTVNNETGVIRRDIGSSLGPGREIDPLVCGRYVVFEAYLDYTPESSESSDSATFGVSSNVPGAPTGADLRRVGISSDSLLGDRDDVALFNATAALPLLMAERGEAPALGLDENSEPIRGDRPTGRPGSDFLRTYGGGLFFGLAMVVVGLGWAFYAARLAHYFDSDDESDDESDDD